MRFGPAPSSPPSKARFKAGVFCIVLNYVLGWPFLLAVESAAALWQSPLLALIGPIVYACSWGLLGLGLWLSGPEAVTYVTQGVKRMWRRSDDGEE